ncbi:DUF4386 domain-containing protein [Spongiactinospora rosea]|uniref:DUF4386 domain-containing protein n=2 Tax=Spongiactinospora rosea TaxID=2248750 RepID=A0A366LT08_9ACTN|nr:DUF4386 domain-containing protein [Spongiactinospora rosea]
MGRASLVAGIALLLMTLLAGFANFVAIEGLTTPGDAAKTARDIAGSETMFRWGVAAFVLVAVLDVIVAGALLALFEPVDRRLSELAAWFRIAYAAVLLVAAAQLVIALDLLDDPGQVLRAVESFTTIWHLGLLFFACHLLLIGYLGYRSGFMPRVIGILLVLAGLGYLGDGLGLLLVRNYSFNIALFTFVGEVVLIFWLLISGRRLTERPGTGEAASVMSPAVK